MIEKDMVEEKENNVNIHIKMLEAQELERQRIARDLHDSTVQNLTNCVHKLEYISKIIDTDPERSKMELIMLEKNTRTVINEMREIIYNLRQMSIEEIQELHDVSEGLEFTIKKAANSCNSLVELLNIIKSKRYTTTRIQRILLYALLNITKKDMLVSKKTSPYIRVLGFNERGKYLISEISKANPKLEIITSVKKFIKCNTNKNLGLLLDKDIWATNVYTIGYENDSWCNLDFTHKIEL